jgi:hypothetical protein
MQEKNRHLEGIIRSSERERRDGNEERRKEELAHSSSSSKRRILPNFKSTHTRTLCFPGKKSRIALMEGRKRLRGTESRALLFVSLGSVEKFSTVLASTHRSYPA